jgi:hypothetical protein
MPQIFKSGAFLQQCWSVHPLCIVVKRLTEDRTLILSCSSCRSAHHLALASVALRAVAGGQAEEAREASVDPQRDRGKLAGCLANHAGALSLREMDVFEDQAVIRCAECRRLYALTVAAFETHQR